MLGDNMLNRAASFDAPPSRRRLTVSSEFPANIDQQFARPSSQRLSNPRRMPHTSHLPPAPSQPTPPAERVMSEEAAALSKLKGTNSQMADLLGKCIDVLEIELFEKREKMENKENIDQYSPDEASLVSVLAGIKHVRDVLSGKQPSFDPSVIPSTTPVTTTPTTPTATGTAVPTTPTTAVTATATAGGVTDTASTDDQPSLKDWDVVDYQEDDKQSIQSSQDPGTKPLPQLQSIQSQESHTEPLSSNKSASVSAPSSSAARRTGAPKENVVYSIEDLLSDPTLQKENTSPSKRNKFNWMLDEQEHDKDERPAHLFRPTTSPRKRASVNFSNYAKSPPSPSSGSAVQTVDPLGAKSTD